MKALLPVLYLGALGAVYALVFYFNHKTPLPKGCEDLKAQCKGCHDHSCCNNCTEE
ncbi:MAG: hypothetical protein ACLT16_13600 [[Clostridium] innocuum]